jgi:hypothetical protein
MMQVDVEATLKAPRNARPNLSTHVKSEALAMTRVNAILIKPLATERHA